MSLVPGARLGSYEIVALLGAGGMGEVYRARDGKLGRDVAIKVLPDALAADRDRVARFEREAKTLAALNEPHIAQIFGFEDSDGVHALVMELVEGPTLADRIAEGPMPPDDVRSVAEQIAEALEAAHEQGIVHRDLKPANVKVRPDGTVKLLDFGLAKAFDPSERAAGATMSPTLSVHATGVGIILGTAAYMAPEQARGRSVDRRADIWAFGCVLYEMLSGRRTFDGDTAMDAISAVISREPDWSALPSTTSAGMRRLLSRCLEKDPKRRLRDIADARHDLDDAVSDSPASTALTTSRSWNKAAAVAGVVGGLVAVLIGTDIGLRTGTRNSSAKTSLTRFSIDMPPNGILGGVGAISPDGSKLVYSVAFLPAGRRQLYLRALDQLDATPIAGTDDMVLPFFSPDGLSIAGDQVAAREAGGTKLKRLSLVGGTPVTLADLPQIGMRGGSWNDDNTIVFTAPDGGLSQIPAIGGAAQTVTTLDRQNGERSHLYPQQLPGGDAILFTVKSPGKDDSIVAYSRRTRGRRTLVEHGHYARYVASGHLLFEWEGHLMAVPFDAARLAVTGTAVKMLDGPMYNPPSFTVSGNGTLVYALAAPGQNARQLVVVDRQGKSQPLIDSRRAFGRPRYSPTGDRVAITIEGEPGQFDVWIVDIDRAVLTRFTIDGGSSPAWKPDGTAITYATRKGTRKALVSKRIADGVEEVLFESDDMQEPASWSPDGRSLLFQRSSGIWVLENGQPRPLLQTRYYAGQAVFGPDGQWVAYESDESGQREVYVQPFPGPGRKTQVSIGGGSDPSWPSHGGAFIYRNDDRFMMVAMNTRPDLRLTKPTLWFDNTSPAASTRYYGGSPDGQRLLIVKYDQGFYTTRINVVENWLEELKARVPTK